ncbi:MAG: glycosyltransferase [Gammaproteobacteria bacterium]
MEGPIEISVSNASKVAGNAFHVTETEACGLRLTDLSRATPAEPAFPGRYEILTDLLPIIPKPAVFGLERLLPVIKRRRPEVVYVWQDGAVLMAALAALAAGVPRIVLSLRGMPPNLRTNIAKQEFRDMYAALARVPGVSFTANNRAAARAYCRWLDLPWSAFTVIPNAIERPPTDAAQHEIDLWNDFDARTRGARFTLGGVFRFEPNKRPRLWIEFAARLLSADPRWRFVLVGGGRQFSECRELAARLGVAGRILFVGHSHNVGFWLGKMDVLSLLSEHEGLPNVLLEAQAMGVPVVATPAGGATEALDAGRTGMLLDSAEAPRFADYAQKLGTITRDPRDLARMKLAASTRAEELFAVGRVLAHTVAHFKGQELHGPSPARDRPVKLERTA